ncbi:hypothetical protein PV08_06682 [Exophiala spinifera]|uniref:AB hydrolase-1 domain-containing protein n=1 Tax=Exophiala spinifera TaxID=91928 RepID=A0A0D1YFT0_9EURO|nr:uncharacterized protein PV08_06682 [Exophiala spinifera]KIW13901.1 hypothetical protein PV08_06682 [Exophiala spinifera]
MSNTSILFFPGSYCLTSLYQPLLDAVTEAGYEIKAIHPPTVGPRSRQGYAHKAPSMYDDASVLAREVEQLADEGKDVIIVGHSYGGVPMTQASKGLGKEERKAQGKPGGIVRLGYMTAIVPEHGQSARGAISVVPAEGHPRIEVDEHGWMLMADPAGTASLILQHLPPDEGTAIVSDFAKHSAQSFLDPVTYTGYKDIPVSYLLCEEDLVGPPDLQRSWIEMIERESGRKVHVTAVQTGHMVNVTAEKEAVDWVLQLAKMADA